MRGLARSDGLENTKNGENFCINLMTSIKNSNDFIFVEDIHSFLVLMHNMMIKLFLFLYFSGLLLRFCGLYLSFCLNICYLIKNAVLIYLIGFSQYVKV